MQQEQPPLHTPFNTNLTLKTHAHTLRMLSGDLSAECASWQLLAATERWQCKLHTLCIPGPILFTSPEAANMHT